MGGEREAGDPMVTVSGRWIFQGHIAGFGSQCGLRAVVGIWDESPYGAFADVMVELPSGRRLLLAPQREIANFIETTYTFEEVLLVPVHAKVGPSTGGGEVLSVEAGPLRLSASIGGRTRLGLLLALVPRAIAVHPRWLSLINPLARLLSPGVRTAGTAAPGRREYYGVTGLRRVESASILWDGCCCGPLAEIVPAVRFGFSSVPATPTLATVQTTIRATRQPSSGDTLS